MNAKEFIEERVKSGLKLYFQNAALKDGTPIVIGVDAMNQKKKYIINDSIQNYKNWKGNVGRYKQASIQKVPGRTFVTAEHGKLPAVNISTEINSTDKAVEKGKEYNKVVY